MSSPKHVERLLRGVEAWHRWREESKEKLDLIGANLIGANLSGADLSRANLRPLEQ
jgi:uncharacterized protein YjbI with pentapeptide repeats